MRTSSLSITSICLLIALAVILGASDGPAGQSRAERAAGGALIGLGIGSLSGNAGKGAAIGADARALAGGAKQQRQMEQRETADQQAPQAQQAQIDRYNKARQVCLEGKLYTVN